MNTMRRLLLITLSTIGVGTALTATAAAQQPAANCPPGSWFCEGSAQPQQPAGQPLQPLPGTQPQQPPVVYQQTPAPPPVVVYQPAPPPVVVVQQQPPPPPKQPTYVYTTTTRKVWRPEWGVNLRL